MEDESIYHVPEEEMDRLLAEADPPEALQFAPIALISTDDARREIERRHQEGACVVCMNNVPCVVFGPCGHVALCDVCNSEYENEKCPVCKQKIVDRVTLV